MLPMIYLSQGYLNALSTCPRKFQYSYLEHLDAPMPAEQQARMVQGTQVHLLMQQRELGLSIDSLLNNDPHLQTAVAALVEQTEHLGKYPEPLSNSDAETLTTVRSPEHCRTLAIHQNSHTYLLTVVYDLLLLYPDQAHILDWKTYAQPQGSQWLATSWQTRLYPYVLAETTAYLPDQITMTYWFAQPGTITPPSSLAFAYSNSQHQRTQQELMDLLTQLTHWLHQFASGTDFPQVPESSQRCLSCPYIVRCQRHHDRQSLLPKDWLEPLLSQQA